MANEYASMVELKDSLSLTGASFADSDIALALTAASRGIDKLCGRRFWSDADAAQIRYYTPRFRSLLEIDDLITLTAVGIDRLGDLTFSEAWTEGAQFVLAPLNAPADGEPWQRLKVNPQYKLPCAHKSVRVTGKFGWVAVPEQIKEATEVLASKLVRRVREAPFGVVTAGGIDEGAAMRIGRNDPDVMFLTEHYRRNKVMVA